MTVIWTAWTADSSILRELIEQSKVKGLLFGRIIVILVAGCRLGTIESERFNFVGICAKEPDGKPVYRQPVKGRDS